VDRAPHLLTVEDATPSRALRIGDLVVGDAVEERHVFDAEARAAFGRVAGDRAPVHGDTRFAQAHGFQGQIIQGLCVTTRFSRLIGMHLPGEHAILERVGFKFRHPTYEGQVLVFRVEVMRTLKPMRVVVLALSLRSEVAVHITGEAQCVVR